MKQLIIIIFLSIAGLCSPAPVNAFVLVEETYLVIANVENELNAEGSDLETLLRRIYLKERTNWPNGERSIVFARGPDSGAEAAFRREILRMSGAQIEDHWMRMKQTRGETPPRSVKSSRIVLRQIQLKENAVTVIAKSEFEMLGINYSNIKILIELKGPENE